MRESKANKAGVLCTKRPKINMFKSRFKTYAGESDWLILAVQIQATFRKKFCKMASAEVFFLIW